MLTLERAPLERDRQLLLASSLDEVAPLVSGAAALASWFPATRRTMTASGRFRVQLPDSDAILDGDAAWLEDQRALTFRVHRPRLDGFLTVRSVILAREGFGTEIWVHMESPAGSRGRRCLAQIEMVVDAGLAHMQAELDRYCP